MSARTSARSICWSRDHEAGSSVASRDWSVFSRSRFGASAASTKLHRAIQKSLLSSLGQTNRHLTRLISLARLRGADQEGKELEKAYGGQIVAAAESS